MTEEIDKKLLSDAIEKTQAEITAKPKTTSKKEKPSVTVTQTKKVKDKTIKVTEKKKFKDPEIFKNHPLAKSIDKIVDSVILEDGFSSDVGFGASCILTIDYYLADIPDHPLLFLAIAGGMVAFKGLSNHGMIPDILPKIEKPETKKPEGKYINYELKNGGKATKLKQDIRIDETPEYKKGVKK